MASGSDGVASTAEQELGEYRETNAEDVADMLKNAHSVIITPGYGMAGGAGAVSGGRDHPQTALSAASRCASVSTRWPVVCLVT